MPRVTKQRIRRVIATARHNFNVDLTPELARRIVIWDYDNQFLSELEDSGHLDTASREFFAMALLEFLLPGKPTVQDGFISFPLKRWHFPLYGSSDDYVSAFKKALREAVKNLRAKA